MTFVTLLLDEALRWARGQPGTASLRALLYLDEAHDYLPPQPASPPSKRPLTALLKQSQGYGLGVLLGIESPKDLDPDVLSSVGTRFVGRLPPGDDRARLLEVLERADAKNGRPTGKEQLDRMILAVGGRVFLLHDVHRDRPLLFQSRHTLCYQREPIRADRIDELMGSVKARVPAETEPMFGEGGSPEPGTGQDPSTTSHVAPVLDGVSQYYLPLSSPIRPNNADLLYLARVLGFATVTFFDKKRNAEYRQAYHLLAAAPGPGQPAQWLAAETFEEALAVVPDGNARWDDVPESLNSAKKIKALEKAYAEHLYGHARLTLLINHRLNVVGTPGEDRGQFQQRCRAQAAERAKLALGDERAKYGPRFAKLRCEVPPEPPPKSRDGVLDVFGGLYAPQPRWEPLVPLSPEEQSQLADLMTQWFEKRGEILEKWRRVGQECAELQLTPRKASVQVTQFGVGWVPFWRVADSDGQVRLIAAYR